MHSPLARAMYVALRQARLNDKFQDPLYLFLELVRAGVMHGHLWSNRAFSGGPSFGTGACGLAEKFLTASVSSSVKEADLEIFCFILPCFYVPCLICAIVVGFYITAWDLTPFWIRLDCRIRGRR